MMKILQVIKGCPFPPTNGYKSDTWSRLLAMNRLGYKVHVVITTRGTAPKEADLAEVRKLAARVDVVPRGSIAASLFTLQPSLVAANRTLKALALEDEYEMTLADSELVTPIFDNPRLRTRLRVVRVHNDEKSYFWTLAKTEEQLHWKALFALEALRFGRFSRNLFRKLDAVWFISKSERDRTALESPAIRGKCCWMPPAIDLKEGGQKPGPQEQSREVLIVAGLANPLNREGVGWYIRNVHPILQQDPAYRLTIAGSARGSKKARRFVDQIDGTSNCEVHLDRSDLSPLYGRAAVLVNPMQRGAGVKIKTIHATLERRPLVTTTVGAEGAGLSNGDHIRIEDDPRRFAAAIQDIFNHPEEAERMTARAHRFICEHYDHAVHLRHFLSDHLPPQFDDGERSQLSPHMGNRQSLGTLMREHDVPEISSSHYRMQEHIRNYD